ncbi:MAG: PspC domain-containing protein [bacterium]
MPKKLYRSNQQRMVAGVCGGLAEYFDVDVTIIRLVVAFLIISSAFTGLFFYLVAALIIPPETGGDLY